MKAIKQSGLAAVAVVLAMTVQGAAQVSGNTASAKVPSAAQPVRTIVVSLQDHKLALLEDGQVKKVYPVAVGKPSTPSPTGKFTIARRVMNPTYSHDGRVVLPGPNNPVGTRWMGLSIKGYGIHGTNEPKSIGKAASHGCIRMTKPDIEELYALVQVGDTVELIGQRDEETAQLFGDHKNPASPATAGATQIAKAETSPAPAATNRDDNAKTLTAVAAIATVTGTM